MPAPGPRRIARLACPRRLAVQLVHLVGRLRGSFVRDASSARRAARPSHRTVRVARRLMNQIAVREHGVLGTRAFDGLLRGLAGVAAGRTPVVSLYIDARWDDEQKRERARLTLKNDAARAREQVRDLPPADDQAFERD